MKTEKENYPIHIHHNWDECPVGHEIRGYIHHLPELMMKDRNLILEKIESLAQHSNTKDEENERNTEALGETMMRIKKDTDEKIKEVKDDVCGLKKDVGDIKALSQETASTVSRGMKVVKWILGIFTAVITALLIAGLLALGGL